MNRLRYVLLGCGVTLFGLLLARIGPQPIVDAFARLSWSVLLIVWFPFALINICDTLGWQFAFPRQRVPFRALFMARLAGEAFNATTPGASLGGEPIKAALIRHHIDYHESAASLVVAKTTITISQVLFLAGGLLLAPRGGVDPLLFHALLVALVVEALATTGFVVAQTTRLLGVFGAISTRLGLTELADGSVTAHNAIKRYYRGHPGSLALSIGFHFLGWVLSAVETYMIVRLLGVPISLPMAIGIEAAGTAIRFASFFVPAHIGALEGGNVATFVAFGLEAATGLSFTLVRRLRELVWVGAGFLLVLYRDKPIVKAPSLEAGA